MRWTPGSPRLPQPSEEGSPVRGSSSVANDSGCSFNRPLSRLSGGPTILVCPGLGVSQDVGCSMLKLGSLRVTRTSWAPILPDRRLLGEDRSLMGGGTWMWRDEGVEGAPEPQRPSAPRMPSPSQNAQLLLRGRLHLLLIPLFPQRSAVSQNVVPAFRSHSQAPSLVALKCKTQDQGTGVF